MPKIEQTFNKSFNSVLLNLYRDGQDSVAWHADDEDSLGEVIDVASYSLLTHQENFNLEKTLMAPQSITLS